MPIASLSKSQEVEQARTISLSSALKTLQRPEFGSARKCSLFLVHVLAAAQRSQDKDYSPADIKQAAVTFGLGLAFANDGSRSSFPEEKFSQAARFILNKPKEAEEICKTYMIDRAKLRHGSRREAMYRKYARTLKTIFKKARKNISLEIPAEVKWEQRFHRPEPPVRERPNLG